MVPPLEYSRTTGASNNSSKLLLLPLLLVTLAAASCPPPRDPNPSPFAEYEPFGLGGGHGAGTVVDRNIHPIVLASDWGELAHTREEYPSGSFNYTRLAESYFYANWSIGGIEAAIGNTEEATLTIRDGYVASISPAGLLEHIQSLDLDTRRRLISVLAPAGSSDGSPETRLRLLTEVIVVSDGSIDFRFRDSIDADTGRNIADLLQMELVSMSRDGKMMTLEYSADTAVGYKDPFTYYDPDAIPSIVDELRKEPTQEFYRDLDGDGVGGVDVRFAFARPAGYSEVSGDCLDLDDRVFPGQTNWFDASDLDGRYDFNCDGKEVLEITTVGECSSIRCDSANEGWDGRVPMCGESERWIVDCELKGLICTKVFETRQQKCQ